MKPQRKGATMTTGEEHTGTPRTVICPMCGEQFTCGLSATCWCAGKAVPEEVRRQLAARYETCVCSACLDRLIDDAQKR
jgi:hypothetical protein